MPQARPGRRPPWRRRVLRYAETVGPSVAAACRLFGISRTTFYYWRERFAREGPAGLSDRSRRPFRRARTTSADIVAKILYLRLTRGWGPERIRAFLERRHHIRLSGPGIWKILGRLGLNRLSVRRPETFIAGIAGNDRISGDLEAGETLELLVETMAAASSGASKRYRYIAFCDETRLGVTGIFKRMDSTVAADFLAAALERLPFPVARIVTPARDEFGGVFHWQIVERGIVHEFGRPEKPVWLNARANAVRNGGDPELILVGENRLLLAKIREWKSWASDRSQRNGR